jgi:glycyl-tRNA synthetase
MSTAPTLDTIVALCKRRGFVFPTSDIYGGVANSYDYGPAGTELLRNIRNAWWRFFITGRADMVGLDTQILLHPQTWVASGHVGSFSDPLVEDTKTHKRYWALVVCLRCFQGHLTLFSLRGSIGCTGHCVLSGDFSKSSPLL